MLDEGERTQIEGVCRRLMMRYASAIDLHDLDRLLTAFSPEVEWVRPGTKPMRGHGDMRLFFETLWGARAAKNPHYLDVHLLTTCSIEVESADRATGTTWCMMYSAPDHDGAGPAVMPAVPEVIVLYRNVSLRLPQGWRIARHEAEHLFKSPAYTPPAIPQGFAPEG